MLRSVNTALINHYERAFPNITPFKVFPYQTDHYGGNSMIRIGIKPAIAGAVVLFIGGTIGRYQFTNLSDPQHSLKG
jgi:hypothetical protein